MYNIKILLECRSYVRHMDIYVYVLDVQEYHVFDIHVYEQTVYYRTKRQCRVNISSFFCSPVYLQM